MSTVQLTMDSILSQMHIIYNKHKKVKSIDPYFIDQIPLIEKVYKNKGVMYIDVLGCVSEHPTDCDIDAINSNDFMTMESFIDAIINYTFVL